MGGRISGFPIDFGSRPYNTLALPYQSVIGTHVLKETSNKTVQKVPTSPTVCASTNLWTLKWLSCQRSAYMYILMNHWIATKLVKNRRTCSKSHHLYIVCSKCLPPARMQACRRWCHVTNRTCNEQSDCSLVLDASSQFIDIWDLSIRSGYGHFEHVMQRWCNLLHV